MNSVDPESDRAAIKNYAKKASKATGSRLSIHHDEFAKALGYEDWHDLDARCARPAPHEHSSIRRGSATAMSEVLTPRGQDNVPFRFRVGRVTWFLEASPHGPLLSIEGSPPKGTRPIYLGLYPVIVRAADGSFAMTRYGNERVYGLGSYGVDEAVEFGRLAGIPVWPRSAAWARYRKQQVESQLAFLGSPAFDAVRRWMRAGGHKLIKPGDWISGLPSMTWTTLVALSDDCFAFHRRLVAEAMFGTRHCTLDERDKIWDAMCERWNGLRADGTALDVPVEKLFSPSIRRRLANV